MTHSVAYDIFELAKDLKEANVSEKQIDALIKFEKAKDEHLLNNLATKKDIEDLKVATKTDISLIQRDIEDLKISTKIDLNHEIELVRKEIQLSQKNTVLWLSGIMTTLLYGPVIIKYLAVFIK